MNSQEGEQLIDITEASRLLGVSVQTLRRWDKAGKLKAIRLPSTRIRRYRKSEIEALIQGE